MALAETVTVVDTSTYDVRNVVDVESEVCAVAMGADVEELDEMGSDVCVALLDAGVA